MLVNGTLNSSMNYKKLLQAAKEKPDFKKLSDAQFKEQRENRYKDYQSHDYELIGNKGARKSVYRSRRGK